MVGPSSGLFGLLVVVISVVSQSFTQEVGPVIPKPGSKCQLGQLDLVIILDASTSVTQTNFDKMLLFTKDLLEDADIDSGAVRVGILTYSTNVRVEFQMNRYTTKADVMNAIDDIDYMYGSTNTADAIKTMANEMFTSGNGDRAGVDNTCIVVTDGVSNINSRQTIPNAQDAHKDNIHVYAVGIGLTDTRELDGIATPPASKNSFNVQNFDQLDGLKKKLFSSLCPAPTPIKPPRPSKGTCGLSMVDLVIVLDASTSVTEDNFQKVRDFCKDLIDRADISSGGVRVGALIYSTEVEIQFYLKNYSTKADIKRAIDRIPYIFGSTNTADALRIAHTVMFSERNGDRRDVENVLVVVTDGLSNVNGRETIPQAETARAKNIHIYAVGIGLSDTRELDAIASRPVADNRFAVKDFEELSALATTMFGTAEQCDVVTVPPPTAGTCASSRSDIIFILDASTSVTEQNFVRMLQFCKDIIEGADIDSGNVRVGALIFSTTVQVEFYLNSFRTKQAVYDAIDEIPYIYGSTNIADALKTARQEMFTVANGDREDVNDVIFLITDGLSNVNSRDTIPEAQRVHAAGIHIFGVGIGLDDTRELDAISSPPASENSIAVDKFEELLDLADILFLSLCEVPPTPVVDPVPSGCGLSKVDVILILDASTSVRQANFDKMLDFCNDIVDKADVDSGSVRIGAIIYSTSVEIQFHLNEYTNSDDLKTAISNIKYIYGSTNSADALETMHKTMFTVSNGDRPDVENIAFMITDGISNINSRRTIPEAIAAHNKDIKVYAVGIGLSDTRELTGMASEPKEDYTFNVQDFDELGGLVDTIFGGAEECAPDLPPVANAGRDVVIQLPTDTVVLTGRASTDDKGVVIYSWALTRGRSNFKMDGEDQMDLTLRDLKAGRYTFTLTVFDALGQSDDDTVDVIVEERDFPPVANAGEDVYIQLPTDFVGLNGDGSTDDKRVVSYQWTQISGSDQIGVFPAGSSLDVVGLQAGTYEFRLTVFDELGQQDEDTVRVIVQAADNPPVANAGADVEIQLPQDNVRLSGSRSTDDVAVVSYYWTLISGNARGVRLLGVQNEELNVNGLRAGEYVFSLEVADEKGQTDTDTVTVRVRAADKPPTAIIGNDVIQRVPVSLIRLDGSRSFDDVGIVRYRWRRREGDRSVVMSGDRSEVLTLTNLKPGEYKFTLTVVDGAGQRDTDTVTVTILPDDPPVANAGQDYTLSSSVSSIVLLGNRSSDDLGIVTYQWTQLEGDRSVLITDSNAPNLVVSRLTPGFYRFQLTVTDAIGQSSTDVAEITVEGPVEQACGLDRVDLVFVVDASTSVTEQNFKKQLNFMKSIVDAADIDSGSVRVGALTYSTNVEVQFHLNEYQTKADVLTAIDGIQYTYGSTNTADGLKIMREEMFTFRNGDREDVENTCIVITDGVSNINSRQTIPQAELSRDIGIHIYAIGIGLTDTRELDAIASDPASENSFAVNDFDELDGLENTIFTAICEGPPPSTTTTPAPTTTTTTPKPSPTPEVCGLAKTDVVIILDASTSVTEGNFQKMREFVKEFVSSTDVDSGSVRYGLSIYSTDVEVRWNLNDYNNLADLSDAIDNIPYIYGSTNTADALESMYKDMFTTRNGDRGDAPNICILLTDGVSNINSRRTIPEAEAARDEGILIYVIGIGLKDTRELEGIASKPISANLFNIKSFEELKGLEQQIFSASCPNATEPTPIDNPPVANAGNDQYVQLPESSITLSGIRSTDDIGVVLYRWTLIDGPDVDVTGIDSADLQLYNLREGVYTIELYVEDKLGQSSVDTVLVYVLAEPDLPPNANAGRDVEIQLPKNSVKLDGTGSTDDIGVVRYNWTWVSGPTFIRIRGERPSPTVSNLREGEYVFKLQVFDKKGQNDEDTVKIIVKPEDDLPPVANAGRDYTIQLPEDSVTLDGCKSSDDKGIVRYEWQMTSGRGRRVVMRGQDSCTLRLSGLEEGSYTYKLTVYDRSGQASSDSASITVKPEPRRSGYDVIFVLDSSVSPDMFRWMNDYARMIIREMSIDDGEFRVGYLIYSNGAYRQFDLNAHDTKSKVFAGIDRVGYRPGSKNTAAALKYVRNRMFTARAGDRDYAKNYVILLTGDGISRDPYDAAVEACRLQEDGVGMFSVGLGEIRDRSELNSYSSLPTEDYQLVIEDENQMGELPGLMLYNLKNGSPRKTPCPAPPVTTTRKPGVCASTGDILFILDSSGSVGQENFYRVLNFTYSTIEGLDVDDGSFRVAVITFSDTSTLEFNLNEYSTKKGLKDGIRQKVRYQYGNTHTAHALRRARTEVFTIPGGDRPEVPNVIVIITDGQSNVNHELTIPEARALKSDGVTIITVAVGFTSETSELSGLTSPPVHDNLIYVEDYAGLIKLKDKLIEPLCRKSDMCRSGPCQNGGVCVDGIRSFVCMCPDEYFGETCNKKCGEAADVVIVLDSSNTVGQYNFGRLKEYAQHLVREMNKDSCDINIGFMKYSSAPMVQVFLGMHTDTETNIRALESISYSRGRANMAAAFRALRTEMFNGRGGDRPNARNIAYFLTDGTNDVNADMAEPEADLTISSGTRIIPIGINMRNRFELDNIATLQGISVIEIDDEPGLIEKTDTILRPMYEGNDFCAENPCRNGGKCKNEPFGFSCDCPIGYTGDTCGKRCTAKGNVVFAVDTSRYMTRTEMKRVRKFLRSVVRRMRFKRKAFSVGMVQFSDFAKVSLNFDKGVSKKAVRSAISGLRVYGGDPEPANAIAKANYRIFRRNRNGRNKPEYLILITKSMRKELDVLHEANKLKVQGTRILGIGLGLTKNEQDYMESAVSLPAAESTWFANDVTDLNDVADNVVSYMCDDEDLCAENPCLNGGTCMRRGGDFYCECGVGYAGRYCQNRCNARADVVFLLDSSGSIGLDDFRRVKQFVHNMVSDLRIGKDYTRIGLATFSSQSRRGFYLNKYYDSYDLQNAIAGIQYEYGNTNTADGLRLVREYYFNGGNGDRPEIQDFLILITDGASNVLPDQTIVEADMLKKKGVHIYAVGIGSSFDPFEINSVATPPASENAYMLADYRSLSNISSNIVKRTCRDPSVCDENPCRNGGVCIPGVNGAFCECRVGFRGPYCDQSCVTTKDIFFVLDSSDSVGPENFKKALNFVSRITEEFSSKDSYNRFALLTYSTDVQIVFSLGRYSTLPILQNAIHYTRYRPGRTNTAGALRTVQEISAEPLGDRRDAENIIFLFADGDSNVDEGDTIPAGDDLKNAGARIMTIGVNMQNFDELEKLSSKPKDLFKVNNYSDLDSVLEDVIDATCENGNVISK